MSTRQRVIRDFLRTVIGASALCMALLAAAEPIWIDVRTPEEFAEGHLTGAVNIEFQDIGAYIPAVTTDRDAEIRLYCRSGRRSGLAQETLVELGYRNVTNEGGLEEVIAKNGGPQMLCCIESPPPGS